MARTKLRSAQLNPTDSTTADANGWVKKDMGSFIIYERVWSFTSVGVSANSFTNMGSTSLPVGVTDTSTLRFYTSTLAGFGGRIYGSLDNGNTNSAVSLISILLGNSSTAGITVSGYLFIQAITV